MLTTLHHQFQPPPDCATCTAAPVSAHTHRYEAWCKVFPEAEAIPGARAIPSSREFPGQHQPVMCVVSAVWRVPPAPHLMLLLLPTSHPMWRYGGHVWGMGY